MRELCRAFANEQVERQKKDFIRLGVLGEWDNPYLTLAYKTKPTKSARSAKCSTRAISIKGLKPVNWCLDCGSALAEAEVEYEDKTSPAIDVAFEVHPNHAEKVAKAFGLTHLRGPAFAVIWTTTPWTLPANEAVSAHPDFTYDLIETPKGALILVRELAEACLKRYELEGTVVGSAKGSDLEHMLLKHPFQERDVAIICGTHVTLEAGTGLVHTAPAHGADDYIIGKTYGLPVTNPVRQRRQVRRQHTGHVGRAARRQDGLGSQPAGRCRNSKRAAACSRSKRSSTATRTAGGTRRRSSSAPRRNGSSAWTTRTRKTPPRCAGLPNVPLMRRSSSRPGAAPVSKR